MFLIAIYKLASDSIASPYVYVKFMGKHQLK